MLQVLLVSAPLTAEERYGIFAAAGSNQPTSALAYLGAVGREAGYDIKLLDASAEGLGVEEALQRIDSLAPDVLGLTATTLGIVAANELAGRAREHVSKVVTMVGGCHITAIPEETMEEFPHFDIGVCGEGERTFVSILDVLRDTGRLPGNLKGTVVRSDQGIQVNPPVPFIENLDELPLPAWDLLPGFPGVFRPSPARVKRLPCASVVLTRGCPYRCSFCDRSVFGGKVRDYSTDYTLRLLRDLRERYGVREILIEDDTFVVTEKKLTAFCERVIEKEVDITWSCLGRADRVTQDLLKLMKRAGCWHVSYGVESGDPGILKAMRKREDLEQIRQAVQWTREAGIKTKGFFMIGFPGETPESLAMTKALALDLALDDISVMQLTPFPGSDIYEGVERYGAFDRDWRKMNILTTVFVPDGFTKEGLDRARADLLRAFYFRGTILFAKARDVIRRPRLLGGMLRALWVLLRVSVFRFRSDARGQIS